MRRTVISTLIGTAVLLGGCSQISGIFKNDKPRSTVASDNYLRPAPGQNYGFAGYDVELFDGGEYYYYGYHDTGLQPLTVAETYNPRDAAFVKLNGASEAADWRNCETRNNGYLFLSEYDIRLDPEFEVCMRNKGYVLTTEAGVSSSQGLSAQSSKLRGYAQSTGYTTGSYYP